jgi:hypothetical protein
LAAVFQRCISLYVHDESKIQRPYVIDIRVCCDTRIICESIDAENSGASIQLSETADKSGANVLRDRRCRVAFESPLQKRLRIFQSRAHLLWPAVSRVKYVYALPCFKAAVPAVEVLVMKYKIMSTTRALRKIGARRVPPDRKGRRRTPFVFKEADPDASWHIS